MRKVQKFSKSSQKKTNEKQQIPYTFIIIVFFKQELALTKNKAATYAIKLLMHK